MEKILNQMLENRRELLNIRKTLNSIIDPSRTSIEKLMEKFFIGKKVKIEFIKGGFYIHYIQDGDFYKKNKKNYKVCGLLEKIVWHSDNLYFYFVNGAYLSTTLPNIKSIKIVK